MFSVAVFKRISAIIFAFFVLLLVSFSTLRFAQMGGGGMGGSGGMGGTGNGHMGNGGMGFDFRTNMMGSGMGGMMLVSGDQPFQSDGKLVDISGALGIARQYLSTRKEANLALDEIEEYEYNFYVVVKETDSNYKAFQLIIDKWAGTVMPEPGPNMMWNTKYFGGGMGRSEMMSGFTKPNTPITISPDAATTAANKFLKDRFAPGRNLAVANPSDIFYGYYNFDVNDVATGKKYGMLSVNGASGQVWYHTWHGNFIQGQEITN